MARHLHNTRDHQLRSQNWWGAPWPEESFQRTMLWRFQDELGSLAEKT